MIVMISSSSSSRSCSSFGVDRNRCMKQKKKKEEEKKKKKVCSNSSEALLDDDDNDVNEKNINEEKVVRVAIIGSGFAGLACANAIVSSSSSSSSGNDRGMKIEVTMFASEHAGIGGASAIAAGLLHSYTPKGQIMKYGREGYTETLKLLKKAQSVERIMLDPDLRVEGDMPRFSGERRRMDDLKVMGEMFREIGVLKPARNEKEKRTIVKNISLNESDDDNNIRFVERAEIEVLLRNKMNNRNNDDDVNNSCGFYVENGIVVDAKRYLQALKVLIEFEAAKRASTRSFKFIKKSIENLQKDVLDDENFDKVIVCAGAELFKKGFLDDDLRDEILRSREYDLELQGGQALVLRKSNVFSKDDDDSSTSKWEMPGILGSHYLSPYQRERAMFGPTKERDEDEETLAIKASTAGYKDKSDENKGTIEYLLNDLNEKVLPSNDDEIAGACSAFTIKDVEKIAYGVRVNSKRSPEGRFPKIIIVRRVGASGDHKSTGRKKAQKRLLVVTALGARGLLYHALLGTFVHRLLFNTDLRSSSSSSNETVVPKDFL
jgi:glycine/D-amino acid oxidase-like deaminating enzyme